MACSGADSHMAKAHTSAEQSLPPVIAFVGRSGSGKTTLLLQMIPLLQARGLRIAVIKHTSHPGIETDRPGTDSRRLWDVGARQVVLVTPDRVASVARHTVEPPLRAVLATVQGADLVLLEGYKRSCVPKIEVIREACSPEPIPSIEQRIACVTDVDSLALGCPVFGFGDVPGVVDFLVARFTGERDEKVAGD